MKSTVTFVFFVVLIAAAAKKGDGDDRKLRERDDEKLHDRVDEKLHNRVDEKLHDRVDKMAEQMSKQIEQIGKQNKQMSKLNDQLVKLQAQNNELHQNLERQADSQINPLRGNLTNIRLFDVKNETFDFLEMLKYFVKLEIKDFWISEDKKIKKFVKGEIDGFFISEQTKLKDFVKAEIKDYLINERICVSGRFRGHAPNHIRTATEHFKTTTQHVDFGYKFPRKPAFSVAMSRYADFAPYFVQKILNSTVTEVTNSSADVFIQHSGLYWTMSWIACL